MAYSTQKVITEEGRLLDEKGRLKTCGRADRPMLSYSREDIPMHRQLRLKEWDCYLFGDDTWQVTVTIADNSYMGMVSASLVNIKEGWDKTNTFMQLLPMGRYELPAGSEFGDIVFRSKDVSLNISLGLNQRRLTLRYVGFDDVKELYVSAVFECPKEDSMALALSFPGKKNAFYYNHKINCMPTSATVRLAGQEIEFDPKSTFGCFDWGRGIWPYKNRWVWCSAGGLCENRRFGLNLGTGFGDRSEAGENTFFYDGKAYKIGEIDITVPTDFKKEAWTFIGEEGDVNIRMVPMYDRFSDPKALGLIEYHQHQVFGKYYGTVMLRNENGEAERLVLDGIVGFAEEVISKW